MPLSTRPCSRRSRRHLPHIILKLFPPKEGLKRPTTCLKQDIFKNHEVKHLSDLEAINSLSSIIPQKQLQRAKYCSPSLSRSPLEVTEGVAQLRAAAFGPNLAIYISWCLFLQQRFLGGMSPALPGATTVPSLGTWGCSSLYQHTNTTAELLLACA